MMFSNCNLFFPIPPTKNELTSGSPQTLIDSYFWNEFAASSKLAGGIWEKNVL